MDEVCGLGPMGSTSNPELGTAINPFIAYSPITLSISEEEEEAGKLYYSLARCTIAKSAFSVRARDLSRRSRDGGSYLTWLVLRGPQWPRVKINEVFGTIQGNGINREGIRKVGVGDRQCGHRATIRTNACC